METWFLRSESPPEGRAKYRNNIPPTTGSTTRGLTNTGQPRNHIHCACTGLRRFGGIPRNPVAMLLDLAA